jgi:hypothetical protein
MLRLQRSYFETHDKLSLALFNISPNPVLMNRSSKIKAALGIYGFNVMNVDPDELRKKITDMALNCCNGSDLILADLYDRLQDISDTDDGQQQQINQLIQDWSGIYFDIMDYIGLGTSIPANSIQSHVITYIRTGYSYNFWAQGTPPSVEAMVTYGQGGTPAAPIKLYLVHSDVNETGLRYILTHYEDGYPATWGTPRVPVIGVCYYRGTLAGIPYEGYLPVAADSTGIYLIFSSAVQIPANAIFRFSLSITINFLYEPII